jgi:CheY-like chemotaxis protein
MGIAQRVRGSQYNLSASNTRLLADANQAQAGNRREVVICGESHRRIDGGRSQMRSELGGLETTMKRILVVDDDLLICTAVRAWLEASGFAVVVADGGATGLNALEGSTFDLMIVDIFMPHMNGFESVRVFHQRAPAVPLIAISGYVFAEQRVPAPDFLSMALRLGATRCLRKPFTPSTLLSVVNTCLLESESRGVRAIV